MQHYFFPENLLTIPGARGIWQVFAGDVLSGKVKVDDLVAKKAVVFLDHRGTQDDQLRALDRFKGSGLTLGVYNAGVDVTNRFGAVVNGDEHAVAAAEKSEAADAAIMRHPAVNRTMLRLYCGSQSDAEMSRFTLKATVACYEARKYGLPVGAFVSAHAPIDGDFSDANYFKPSPFASKLCVPLMKLGKAGLLDFLVWWDKPGFNEAAWRRLGPKIAQVFK